MPSSEYSWEYKQVAGALRVNRQIHTPEFNQRFLEGLHSQTHKYLGSKITSNNLQLNLRIPFPMETVVKAAEHHVEEVDSARRKDSRCQK